MTNNMDEFEQDQFDASEPGMDSGAGKSESGSFFENLRSKPIFKLAVIMGVVGVAVAGALGAFSSKPDVQRAQIAPPPEVKGTPGGSASPFFMEQNKIANDQRVDEALKGSGSALPTPVGQNSDMINLDELNKKDPLIEFRAETERLKQELRAEQQQNAMKLQMMQQQMQQQAAAPRPAQDDSLAQAMQRQMGELMDSWQPRKMGVVNGADTTEADRRKAMAASVTNPTEALAASAAASSQNTEAKTLVPAGTVNYAQLLTEANSDVPGPIMVQILSGPFSGGRAIGSFRTMYEHLVLTFNLISYKGKEYPVNAIALNADTTLSGMATEVDHRYFMRLVLPAAASFMSAFGSAMGTADTRTTVTGDSVLVDTAKKSYDDALYEGLGEVGKTVAGFFQQEAQQTKTLVRVAAGTPMGLFFLQPVKDTKGGMQQGMDPMTMQALMAQGYQQQGMNGLSNGMMPYTNPMQQMPAGYTTGVSLGTGAVNYYPQQQNTGNAIDLRSLTGGTVTPGSNTKVFYSR